MFDLISNSFTHLGSHISASLMPQQLLCATLEKIANKAIAMNVKGTQAFEPLTLKTLTLHLSELNFPISITFQPESLMFTALESASDCSIYTSLNTLVRLQKEQQLTALIKQEKLDIQGDIKIAQQAATIAEHLQIDWESELSSHIGDYPTYKLKQLGQSINQKVKFAQQQISADSTEWLMHEAKLVVTQSEIKHFKTQVTQVNKATQALSQRIEQLIEKANASAKPSPEPTPKVKI